MDEESQIKSLDLTKVKDLKTREEYLLEFEKRLLETLKSLFQSINYNLLFTYGLAALIVMVKWGAISELSLLGSKLALDGKYILTIIPLMLSSVYILINYQLVKIAKVLSALNVNGQELKDLNIYAIPITVENVYLFSDGVAGLILSFARWQANMLIKERPLRFDSSKFSNQSVFKMGFNLYNGAMDIYQTIIVLILRVFGITAMFYLPVAILIFYQYKEFYSDKSFIVGIPNLQDISVLALIITSVFTTISGLFLFSSYLVDLIEIFKSDINQSTKNLSSLIKTKKIFENILKVFKDTNFFPSY